jgi:AcrR family transcriptional regulator
MRTAVPVPAAPSGRRYGPVRMGEKRRGRPPDHDSEQTRAAILATAIRLFGEAGYRGVSMDRLSAEAGLTVRALYHYFPSKRALFDAATADALARFAAEVAARVFVHERLDARVRGYLDVYRTLHRGDPHLVPFIGMVMVDAAADRPAAAGFAEPSGGPVPAVPADGPRTAEVAELLRAFLGTLVDDAIRRGEVHPALDREGAITLLVMLGRGISLSALSDAASFPAMVDALEMLVEGTLLAPAVAPPATEK